MRDCLSAGGNPVTGILDARLLGYHGIQMRNEIFFSNLLVNPVYRVPTSTLSSLQEKCLRFPS